MRNSTLIFYDDFFRTKKNFENSLKRFSLDKNPNVTEFPKNSSNPFMIGMQLIILIIRDYFCRATNLLQKYVLCISKSVFVSKLEIHK